MMKRIVLATWLGVAAGVAAAPTIAAPVPPKLTVGVYPSYPPLDMADPATGKLTGFDVELERDLAERMGTTFVMQETNFAQFVASVQTGRIDLFLNGMNDVAARRELIGFVDYLRSGTQFVVRQADAGVYPEPTALCGRKVAGSRGTTLPVDIAAWSKTHCESEGRPPIVFQGADNNIDARSQLKQGRADAMAQDSLTIPYIQSQEKGVFHTLGEPFDITVMGIGVAKDNLSLSEALRSALQAIIDDGSYAALIRKWGLPTSSAIPRATINMSSTVTR